MQLHPPEVHIWLVNINDQYSLLQHTDLLLSQDEKMRCQDFTINPHQTRFMIMRMALRIIISNYLQTPANEIKFHYNGNGKPVITTANAEQINFNLSHSHELGVIAIAKRQAIGVDVERMRERNQLAIAKRFFHHAEYQLLSALPPHQQNESFCQLWAKKEALIKAMGATFATTAKHFSLPADHNLEVLFFKDRAWHIYPLTLAANYKGALASDEKIKKISVYTFNAGQN